jgi:uncharacterized protein with PhoU and TrkA domain
VGAYIIYRIGNYKGFNKKWDRFIKDHLAQHLYPQGSIVEEQFEVSADYGVVKAAVIPGSPLAMRPISELELEDDLRVLGIQRGKRWISHPGSGEVIDFEDVLVVYGPLDALREKFH